MLKDRTMSGFPVSIGTGLALESLFDPIIEVYDESRKVPERIDINNYSLIMFNIVTLIRNILNASNIKNIAEIKVIDLYDTLLEEIDFLFNFLSDNNIVCEFYINDYKFVKNKYKHLKGKLREPVTSKQLIVSTLIEKCLKRLRMEDDVYEYNSFITDKKNETCLIFTHVPYDLLSWNNFIELDLLESHTGKLKKRSEWNTKYYPIPNKDMSFLPFIEYLLVTFGDHVMFHPDKLEKRLEVYEHVKKLNLHSLSTDFNMLKF